MVVGLGNPGPGYARQRHNVGFWCLDLLSRRWGIAIKGRGRLASVGEGPVESRYVMLVKPRTFVNRSGDAVAPLLQSRRVPVSALLVICDDLDLPVGHVRLRPQGGHGGHNGLKSVIAAVSSDAFPRIRIGIGRPTVSGEPTTDPQVVADYVLSVPPAEERQRLEEAMARAATAVAAILQGGLEAAMTRFNDWRP